MIQRNSILKEVLAYSLIVLFAYTAINKWLDPAPFIYVLNQIPFVKDAAGLFAFLVPATELLAVGLLVFPSMRKMGYALSFWLMLTFTGYVGGMLLFASHLPCSCGGIIQQLGWPQHLVLNLVLTLCSYVAWRPRIGKENFFPNAFQPT
jgi:hypothetical protein